MFYNGAKVRVRALACAGYRMSFNNLLQLLDRPPASMAYLVIVLFALEAMVGMAREEWRRMRRQEYRRISWGLTSLFVVRVLWVVLEGLRWRGLLSDWPVWIPIQELITTVSFALLVWAVTPLMTSPLSSRRVPPLWLGATGAALALFVISLFVWPPAARLGSVAYYGHWLSYAWGAIRLVLMAGSLFVTFTRGGDFPVWLGAAFSALFLGDVAWIAQSFFVDGDFLSVWVRIAEMVAYPLLALALHQSIVADLYSYGQEFKTVSEESLRQTRELLFMLETAKATTSSLDLDDVLDGIVENVVLALNADQCAIAFSAPDDPDAMQIVATYDPLHGDRLAVLGARQPGPTFRISEFPVIGHALAEGQQMISNGSDDNIALQGVFDLLGSSGTGPLIVQPLVSNEKVMGALLLGNARSKRPFSQADINLCRALAGQVATATENVRLYQDIEMQARQMEGLLRIREVEGDQGRMILEGIAEGMLVTDAVQQVIVANPAMEALLHRPKLDMVGRALIEVLPGLPPLPDDGIGLRQMRSMVEHGGLVLDVEIAALRDEREIYRGVVVIARDVTQPTRSTVARFDFVRLVSQELSPYLESARGNVDLLLEEAVGELNPTQQRFLNKAKYSISRMGEMAQDLVDVSELGPMGLDVRPEPTSIAEILASSTVAVQGQIEERRLTVNIMLQEDLPMVLADARRFGQIVESLLDNACKYTRSGGTIDVSAEIASPAVAGDEPMVLVAVKDTGIGIAPEEQEKVFDLFYRAESDLSLEAGGAGLGLSIARALVEAQGGSIWVDSELGVGSTFSFTLPAAPETLPDMGTEG
jgi:signal transduction histidine kinase